MKNNKIKKIVLFVVLIIIFYIAYIHVLKIDEKLNSNEPNEQMNLEMELIAYAHAELNFTKLDVEVITQKIENAETFFLYTGRMTCQWCRKMVPILSKLVVEKDISIFYLDSENTDTDSQLSTFREKYGIKTVPSIIYFLDAQNYYSFSLNSLEDDVNKIEQNLELEFQKCDSMK